MLVQRRALVALRRPDARWVTETNPDSCSGFPLSALILAHAINTENSDMLHNQYLANFSIFGFIVILSDGVFAVFC